MLLEASAAHTWQVAVWATVLSVGFLTLVGLARAGSILFWHVRDDLPAGSHRAAARSWSVRRCCCWRPRWRMSVFAAPIQRYTAAAAQQLEDRGAYARAVLGDTG